MKFKIGDIVQIINEEDGYKSYVGATGIIMQINTWYNENRLYLKLTSSTKYGMMHYPVSDKYVDFIDNIKFNNSFEEFLKEDN